MSGLIPYAPRVLAYGSRFGGRVARRYAGRIFRGVRVNRGTIGLSAGSLASGRRRRRPARASRGGGRKRTRVGERPGTSTAKRNDQKTNGNLNSRTLYVQPLLNLPRGDAIDQRERQVVNFRGIKFCHSMGLISGTQTGQGQSVYLNRAIISEKGCDDSPATDKFFRGNGTGRGRDFNINLSALDFHCLPMNTDKWNVHKHSRSKLKPFSDTSGGNFKTFSSYFKLNRQIRYEESGDVPTGKQVYYVYWFDFQGKDEGQPVVSSQISHDLHMNRYFREPK
jgi:hypothetical protein